MVSESKGQFPNLASVAEWNMSRFLKTVATISVVLLFTSIATFTLQTKAAVGLFLFVAAETALTGLGLIVCFVFKNSRTTAAISTAGSVGTLAMVTSFLLFGTPNAQEDDFLAVSPLFLVPFLHFTGLLLTCALASSVAAATSKQSKDPNSGNNAISL